MGRLLIRAAMLVVIAGVALVVYIVIFLNQRDPLTDLPSPRRDLPAMSTMPVKESGRRITHVTLAGGALGDIGFVVSLPDPLPAKKIPVLVVLGGLGTGESNIRTIKNIGANAVIGYDWLIPVRFPQGTDFLRQAPELYRDTMTIPGQIASMIEWLVVQPWADEKRIGLLGFSLGALAAPAAQNLAQHDGASIDATILAYGGAPLGALFAANPHMKPEWLRAIIGPVIGLLLRPLDPLANLPRLSGHFLVLEGRDDRLIPEAARVALRDAVPPPKDVVILGGDHMGIGPDKDALLAEIIAVSRDWLVRNGAADAPK